jgi:hypothetical protein
MFVCCSLRIGRISDTSFTGNGIYRADVQKLQEEGRQQQLVLPTSVEKSL